MALEGLAADVDPNQVHALLLARTPAILDPTSEDHALYEAEVQGITTEVVSVTGATPTDGYRGLTLRTITVGVAAQLEFGLFPEQQLGDTSRGQVLQARYEKLLERLASAKEASGDIPTAPRPGGSFPAAGAYPDPAERCSPAGYIY